MKKRFNSYEEAKEYILRIPKFTTKNSIKENLIFYKKLGKPGNGCNIIHVAGTNGKGSVCSYMDGILQEYGCVVGMFTSPHLVSIRERIQINRKNISKEQFLEVFQFIITKITKKYHPTFFEILFFMAMLIYEKNKVEYIILETGLGGRLDITNIIEKPIITVITKIGKDHTEYLGNTIEEIAKEKAGILKKGIPLVFLDDSNRITDIIVEEAQKKQIMLFPIKPPLLKKIKFKNKTIDFSIKHRYYEEVGISLRSAGIYQIQNVALAIGVMEVIFPNGTITKEMMIKGITSVVWQGRMEEIISDVFLDGAHNIEGIKSFVKTVKIYAEPNKKNNLLFSVMKDKEYEEMIRLLVEDNLFDFIVLTEVEGGRAVDVLQLQEVFKKYTNKPIHVEPIIKDAWSYCLQEKRNDNLYIVGSLYLVGHIKEIRGK